MCCSACKWLSFLECIVGGFEFQIVLYSLAKCLFIQIWPSFMLLFFFVPNVYASQLRFLNWKCFSFWLIDSVSNKIQDDAGHSIVLVKNLLKSMILKFQEFTTMWESFTMWENDFLHRTHSQLLVHDCICIFKNRKTGTITVWRIFFFHNIPEIEMCCCCFLSTLVIFTYQKYVLDLCVRIYSKFGSCAITLVCWPRATNFKY